MEEEKKTEVEITEEVVSKEKKNTSKKKDNKKEENKVVEEKEMFNETKKTPIKDKINISKKKILFGLGFVVFIFLVAFFVFRNTGKSEEITKVERVLQEDYYSVECLDTKCDGLIAYSGDASKESKVTIVKSDGTKVASYTVKYNAEDKITKTPVAIGDSWFIYKKTDNGSKKESGYSIANKYGEEVYSTENKLSAINDNLILMTEGDKGIDAYSILNPAGKILFSNVNDIEMYANKSIISAEVKGTKEILDGEGNLLLTNYYISKEFLDEDGETLYLLAKDSKNNAYYYFSVDDKKIVGDSFQNYVENEDKTLTISKKINNKVVNYTLSTDGDQTKIGDEVTQAETVSKIKKGLDTNTYSLYASSVFDKDQKYVFVDNIVENSFGIYEISSKKYTKLYSYKEGTNGYSSIYSLTDGKVKENGYFQVSCSTYSCEQALFYVYDIKNNKEEYKLDDDSLNITNYYQYEDGLKVVKYSYSSSNEKYKGKTVLLDKDNNEVTVSSNRIAVIDKKQLIGAETNSSLVIYSASQGKVINDDNHLASRITVADKKYYKYSTDEKTYILNADGKDVLSTSANSDLMYSDRLIIYIEDGKVNMLNGATGNTSSYKLGENEKMNDGSGDLIPPYRGALFINNSADKKVKVVNSSGNTIKTIDNAEIDSVNYTSDKNVLIITKKISDNKTLYGAHLAE